MLGAATVAATRPYILRADGRDITTLVPLDGFPVHITATVDGPGSMTFTIEDGGLRHFELGAEVTIQGPASELDGDYLFAGHLVNQRFRRRGGAPGRYIECTAAGFGAWLDWKYIPAFSSKNERTGTQILSDSGVVRQLINRFGAPLLPTFVETTTNTMPVVRIKGASLREALDTVADAATKRDDVANRRYFVDFNKRLHWFRDVGTFSAPYRIADGSYTRTVMGRSSLVSLWPLGGDTVAHDAMAYAHAPHNGTLGTRQAGGIGNEPSARAYRFDGATGYLSPTGANLHPGDTFTIEFWCKRGETGTAQAVWSGGTNDVEVGFDASDRLVVIKDGVSNHFVSDDAYTGSAWRHIAVTRSPGDTDVYVNGSAISGTTTARTFVAASGTVNIGRRKSGTDRHYSGLLQHVALYDAKLTAAQVRANRNQGISITPEELVFEQDAMEGRERVYIHGAKGGTGWVGTGEVDVDMRTAFGRHGPPKREDGIDRPDSDNENKKQNYAGGFLKRHNDPQVSGSFSVTGYNGWQVNQIVYITDAQALPDDPTGYPVEIMEVETELLMGNGVLRHTIHFGRVPRSGARYLARATRRRQR